jgi:hypothetical protein
MNLAKEWLRECIDNHPDCQTSEQKLLPTRVIDIGPDGKNPFLFITNGHKGE